jgi:hypothetical protein
MCATVVTSTGSVRASTVMFTYYAREKQMKELGVPLPAPPKRFARAGPPFGLGRRLPPSAVIGVMAQHLRVDEPLPGIGTDHHGRHAQPETVLGYFFGCPLRKSFATCSGDRKAATVSQNPFSASEMALMSDFTAENAA